MLYDKFQYRIMGDRSLIVELGDEISPAVNRRVRDLDIKLMQNPIEGLVETVPTYRSLLIIYDPLRINVALLKQRIEDLQKRIDGIQIPEPKTMEIPVVYGGEYGPDLEWVAQYHKMSIDEVIQLHTETIYQVYMIGFTPGHPYMAELPKALIMPRRETPRTNVPRGSVAIAKNQTVIYPVESPGGLHILGRTPLKLFNPFQSPPTLLEIGDLVRFFSIEKEEFKQWPQ
ncbi:MAG: allophanate hydrolase [Deltaproteobacteria bacterium]|nr:MAG: allophanate hydrolase [Deltaproteobacteria bacterium]